MAVLVTGGAGYIGSHAVLALGELGEEAVVLDDLSTGHRPLVPADVPFYIGDAGDQALVERIVEGHGIDCVMHFAGSIVVPESVADPLAYYENNTCRTRSLIKACVASGVSSFVFSSTAAVYGTPETSRVAESSPLRPESPYGRSKLMTEMMLADAEAAHGLRHAIFRYFNVAGADLLGRAGQASPKSTHLIKVACEASLGRRPGMSVYGTDYQTRDGTCVRDYVHVSDVADAHALALAHLRGGGPSLVANIGHGLGFTVSEIVEAVRRIGGRDFEVRYESRRPGDPESIVAETSASGRLLGWKPKRADIEDIVGSALSWEERLSFSGAAGTLAA